MREETLEAIKAEIAMQADNTDVATAEGIDIIETLVLDVSDDGGLDSHATIFTEHPPSMDTNGGDN